MDVMGEGGNMEGKERGREGGREEDEGRLRERRELWKRGRDIVYNCPSVYFIC